MSEEQITASWLERHITLHTHDSKREEITSGVVHGVGVILSLVALGLLIQKGLQANNPTILTGYIIYGVAMTLLYLSSTLYHFVPISKAKRVLRICDHMTIYILIAGTYTPVMLSLGGYYPMLALGLVWAIAAGGMAFKILFWGRMRVVQLLIYILMGWMIVLVWEPVVQQLSPEFFRMILTGGIIYTSGTIVYSMKKVPYYHAMWHLFVLGGSISLFLAIYLYL